MLHLGKTDRLNVRVGADGDDDESLSFAGVDRRGDLNFTSPTNPLQKFSHRHRHSLPEILARYLSSKEAPLVL